MSLLEKSIREAEEREKQKVQIKELRPPKPPKLLEETIPIIDIDIDYEWIARNSNFQRLFIETLKHHFPNQFKGVNVRASKEVMNTQFNKKLKDVNETLDFVEVLKSGKKGDYSGVMKEFKELLKKREERLKNGTD